MKLCECGCGREIENPKYNHKLKQYQRYLHGHNRKNKKNSIDHCLKISLSLTGKKQPWNAGENNPNYGKHPSEETRLKMCKSHKNISEETRKKLSDSHKGYEHSEKSLNKMCIIKSGKNNPFYGKTHTEESNKKNSKSHKGQIPWNKDKTDIYSEESLKRMSESRIGKYCGENSPSWQGGISFEPYCPKFNNVKKEQIREQYNRKCFNCELDEKDNITKSGKMIKLSVHHVDRDKEQGCNGKKFNLIPLCMSCHRKSHGRGD